MRQTRRKRDSNDASKWIMYFMFIIVAPLLAIFITVGLFKYIIVPRFFPDNEVSVNINDVQNERNVEDTSDGSASTNTPQESNETLTLRLGGMNLYNVQLGSFSSKENAQGFVNELRENDINSYMIANDSFKVFAGSFFLREEADRYLMKIRESYSDAFIKHFDIKGAMIEYSISDQQYKDKIIDIVSSLNQFFATESELWSNDMNNGNASSVKELICKNNTVIRNKIIEIKKNLKSETLIQLLNSIDYQLAKRDEVANNLIATNEQSIKLFYEEYNNILFEYMKLITQS